MPDPIRHFTPLTGDRPGDPLPLPVVRAARATIASGPAVQVVDLGRRTVVVDSDVRFAPGAAVAMTLSVGAISCTAQGRVARVDAQKGDDTTTYRARITLKTDLPAFEAPEDEVITMVPEPSPGQARTSPAGSHDEERVRREELEKTVQKLKAAMKTAEEFLTQVGQQHDSERAKWDAERAELEKRARDAEQRDEAIGQQMASAAERAGQLMQQAEDLRTELGDTQEREKDLSAHAAEAERAWKAEREALQARISEIESAHGRLQQDANSANGHLATLQQKADESAKKAEALARELEAATARESTLAAKARDAETGWAKERNALQDRAKKLETDIALVETQLKQAETDAATLHQALKHAEGTASASQENLKQAETRAGAAQEQAKKAEARVESLAREFATAKEQSAQSEKQIQELTRELKTSRDQTAKAEQRIQELSRDLKTGSEQGAKAEKRAEELARELKVAKDVAAKAEHRGEDLSRELKVLKDQAVAARKDADAAGHELQVIRKEHEKLSARQRDDEAAWQKERESLQHRLQEAEELAGALHERLMQADRAMQEKTALAEELEATRADLAQAQQTILAHGQELLEWVAQREELTIKLQANEARLAEQQKLLDRIRQQVSGVSGA